VSGEDGATELVNLDLPRDLESRPLEPNIKATNAAEE
jgi:hypothetical protein